MDLTNAKTFALWARRHRSRDGLRLKHIPIFLMERSMRVMVLYIMKVENAKHTQYQAQHIAK
jgi:hypothetical protein